MFSNERLKRSTSHEKDMAARSAAAALAPPRPLATHRTAGGACVSALATRGARKAGGDGRMQTAVLRGMPASAKVTCRGHTIFPRTRRSIRVGADRRGLSATCEFVAQNESRSEFVPENYALNPFPTTHLPCPCARTALGALMSAEVTGSTGRGVYLTQV